MYMSEQYTPFKLILFEIRYTWGLIVSCYDKRIDHVTAQHNLTWNPTWNLAW